MPIRTLNLAFERRFQASADAIFGAYGTGLSVGDATRGGFYTHPYLVPDDMDLSRDARLYCRLYNPTLHIFPAAAVALRAGMTRSPVNVIPTDTLEAFTVPIPENWPAGIPMLVEILYATYPFIPGHTLHRGDTIQLRFLRDATVAEDTWPYTLSFPAELWLEYSENCRYGCL